VQQVPAADGLADAAAEQEAAEAFEEITVRRRRQPRKPRSEQLPEHLLRYEVIAKAAAEEQHCAEHGPRQLIGYDVTETLEFERPKLRVRVTKYPKYAWPQHAECGVVQPPRPENTLVEGDRYDTSIATEIETEIGPLPIETLRAGDLVGTAGHGLQPIRWIGRREVPASGEFAPVVFEPGAIGNYRRLTVSPQHRILVDDWRAALYFAEAKVLVAAKHLVNGTTIRVQPMPRIVYLHMIFDRHEIVFAEGVPTESLHLGDMALNSFDAAARAEVLALFPELEETVRKPAHACLSGWEGRLIA